MKTLYSNTWPLLIHNTHIYFLADISTFWKCNYDEQFHASQQKYNMVWLYMLQLYHTLYIKCISISMFVLVCYFWPLFCLSVFMFVQSPLHVSDPSLHASCAVTARTPSVLQTWTSPSHPLPLLHAPPLPPCRGRWRGLKPLSPFLVVPRLHWEWRWRQATGAA